MEKKETVIIPRKKRAKTVIEETGQSKKVAQTVDLEETEEEDHLNEKTVYKDDFILKQRPKGTGEGSSTVLDNPYEPSDSSSSKSKDEEGFLSINDEASQQKSDNERTKTEISDADATKNDAEKI
ncbi:hypothetical protein Tco_0254065 [Tanacetum coccineum]